MPGEFPSEDAVYVSELCLRIRMADFPCIDRRPHLFEIFCRGPTGPDVLKDVPFLFSEIVGAKHGGDIIWLDESSVLIDEHDPVGVAVIDDA